MSTERIVVASLMQELARLGVHAAPTRGSDVDVRLYAGNALVGVIECKAAVTPSIDKHKIYGAIGQVMFYGRAVSGPALPLGICFYPNWNPRDDSEPLVHSIAVHRDVEARLSALGISLMFAWGADGGMVQSLRVEEYAERVKAFEAALQRG
jgi:hypothetical protein